jgi:hypothetical protein
MRPPGRKNTLTAADAQIVEERFQARLSTIGNGLVPSEPSDAVYVQRAMPAARPDAPAGQKISAESGKTPHKGAVDALGKMVRLRDKERRKFVQAVAGRRFAQRTRVFATGSLCAKGAQLGREKSQSAPLYSPR